jgi:2OG-Fe(II) oxygenase superfamily
MSHDRTPAAAAFDFDPAARWRSREVELRARWDTSAPFKHLVVDDFLRPGDAALLSNAFPAPEHPVWLDWRKRTPAQYGKQGPGDSTRFRLLDWRFRQALLEFNSDGFLRLMETVTGIGGLVPDPYFTGGGMHQILAGGILDIHTDFNYYKRLSLYRRLNVLIYLTLDWREGHGGELELWDDAPKRGGKCFKRIPPIYNRLVVFHTDKTSFHGHPNEWRGPDGVCRRSIALYYYTAQPSPGHRYDDKTDFQGYVSKSLDQ